MEPQRNDRPNTWKLSHSVSMSPGQTRASLIAVAVLFLAGVFTVREFLPSLVWAVIIAIGIWPLFNRAAKTWPRHRKRLIPATAVLLIFLTFVVPITLVAVPLANDAHAFAAWVAQARQSGIPPPPLFSRIPYGGQLAALWRQNLGQPGEISTLTSRALQGGLVEQGRRVGAETLHRLVLVGFMLLSLFMLLCEAESVIEQVKVASRRAFGPAGENIGRQMILSVHGTVNGLVLVGLAEGVILGITYLVVGVPHATLFGLMTALLAMVPFGAAIAFGLAAVVLLAVNNVVGAVIVVIIGSVVTFIADHFARPVLIGGATRLPFIWVLLGILGGVGAWGLLGLFLGPALLAALILIWREWVGAQQGPINPPAEAQPKRQAVAAKSARPGKAAAKTAPAATKPPAQATTK
jgi:predicted PurR-regulated permease PerM